ncbi:MAG TPA: alpha/beta fold hydrolase [Mycobacteriales bacterium]|nr:alpha/beta fold hydrolase [Mycobacteriales bacterium]
MTSDLTTRPAAPTAPVEVWFDSGGVRCSAWHVPAADDRLATDGGRPVAVMAHGFGGTKDSGLQPFAERLAAAGIEVLAFDFRGFGASEGGPRQTVSVQRQLEDYRAAMAAAARLPGVDAHRLVLWGASLSGGHVLAAAAGRDDVAAVVALAPLVDGRAAGRLALSHHRPSALLRSTVDGVRSRVASARGGQPVMVPLVARPGEVGALTLDGAYEDYLSIAGPTWRNEIDASIALEMGSFRPAKHAADLRCPVLVQIADFDRSAPPHAAAKAAFKARAQVRHYPCDHFDVWPGHEWFEPAVEHQVHFLRRHLRPAATRDDVPGAAVRHHGSPERRTG